MGFNNPLTPAQLAAAIAGTTLTVTGSVNTTPTTPTPGTDPDTLRVLDQPAINALSAADKANPFVIYNTTTSTINYVVNGNVVVPPAGGGSTKTGTYTGTGTNPVTVTGVGFQPDLVIITDQQSTTMGIFPGPPGAVFVLTGTAVTNATGSAMTADGFSLTTLNVNGRSYRYTAFKGA